MTTIDLGDPNLKAVLANLNPSAGFCLMVDIVGSTAAKDRDLREWIRLMANTFNRVRAWTESTFLKTVGDMLMFWFPDARFHSTTSPLTIFQGLIDMQEEATPNLYLPVKAAITRCNEAYEISFMRPGPDVYGKDIDLTARLLSIAGEGEIVMNEAFHGVLHAQYSTCGNRDQFPGMIQIQGPWTTTFKGFSKPVTVFKWRR